MAGFPLMRIARRQLGSGHRKRLERCCESGVTGGGSVVGPFQNGDSTENRRTHSGVPSECVRKKADFVSIKIFVYLCKIYTDARNPDESLASMLYEVFR